MSIGLECQGGCGTIQHLKRAPVLAHFFLGLLLLCPIAQDFREGANSPTAQKREPSFRTRQPSSPPPRPFEIASSISRANSRLCCPSEVKIRSRVRPIIS